MGKKQTAEYNPTRQQPPLCRSSTRPRRGEASMSRQQRCKAVCCCCLSSVCLYPDDVTLCLDTVITHPHQSATLLISSIVLGCAWLAAALVDRKLTLSFLSLYSPSLLRFVASSLLCSTISNAPYPLNASFRRP